jgi:hypothetical protein
VRDIRAVIRREDGAWFLRISVDDGIMDTYISSSLPQVMDRSIQQLSLMLGLLGEE